MKQNIVEIEDGTKKENEMEGAKEGTRAVGGKGGRREGRMGLEMDREIERS